VKGKGEGEYFPIYLRLSNQEKEVHCGVESQNMVKLIKAKGGG
jgi:hypothetical protein